ncbi:MAG: hypothetical protein QOF61_3257 [Acidobacteriota bacterium]|nr:hypothetical protein [Acidobacteriota bacterium]
MKAFDRRQFLSRTLATVAVIPLTSLLSDTARAQQPTAPQPDYRQGNADGACWLDVCAPFVVEDPARGIRSEIVLTSDTFSGTRGYGDAPAATDYEIYLYDAEGRAVGTGGVARRLTVPAMQTTVIAARDLLGAQSAPFWGGMKIRLRPRGQTKLQHASDLFSSAFVRWTTDSSFDNVHANPDPLQWQNSDQFYYTMPFPALSDYDCTYSLFNPYDAPSAGELTLHDWQGRLLRKLRYELKPHASLLVCLNSGEYATDACAPFAAPDAKAVREAKRANITEGGGTLSVTNDDHTRKTFGYLLIRRQGARRFSVEHPIHQGAYKPKTVPVEAFDAAAQFKAKNILYSPLVFRAKRIGGLTFDSRFHLGTGYLNADEAQWFYPYVTDAAGDVVWASQRDEKLAHASIPTSQVERGVIRLTPHQACLLDPAKLSFPENFSGGLSLAVTPDTTHTLMKVELHVAEWGAHAFTHFRPGLRAARAYRQSRGQDGFATDYITTGARLNRRAGEVTFDELVAVFNVGDDNVEASPTLELFNARGLVTRIALGRVPPLACRHFLLSDLVPSSNAEAHMSLMTLRLTDERAALLMSAVHIDHARRDIALDHGSDRFSTFADYGCA